VEPSDLTTAYLIAGVLGIDMTAITFPNRAGSASPESIDADEGATGAIATEDDSDVLVLVLGDDAPDPAYFTAEPFTDDAVPSGT
jgi:hypothetical protein